MITYMFMGIIIIFIAFATLWGIKYCEDKDGFLTKSDATFLRGFWCIIVVLVHVPIEYQNRVQDMLGSFAYIGVTFFFMTSAYGLKYSVKNKPEYMKHFWRHRLPTLLLPAWIANVIAVLVSKTNFGEMHILDFININGWVKVLLFYYFLFWLIYYVLPKFCGDGRWQDIIMCLTVLCCSMVDRLTDIKITLIWIVEPLGFAYGIIAATYTDSIKAFMKNRWITKTVALAILATMLGGAYLRYKPIYFWGDYVLKIFLGLAILAFMYTLLYRFKAGNRINSFLGNISYEVYLLHGAVYALLMRIGFPTNSGMFIFGALIITVVVSWMINKTCSWIVDHISLS